MSSLILCHKQKAKQPYDVAQIQRKLYTIEELCYYLCNHLYLVDYTIMNETLCDWLDEELGLVSLADELRELLQRDSSVEQFVMTILSQSDIYTTAELNRVQEVLTKLKNQKPLEKQKFKADNLLASGSIKTAILSYQAILFGERDESLDGKFYGRVYGCLGAAYGRLFLYEEAAKMYEAAFQICEETSMLKAYLYACRCYMNREEYNQLLMKSTLYAECNEQLQREVEDISNAVQVLQYEDTLENWKNQYRRINTGEI